MRRRSTRTSVRRVVRQHPHIAARRMLVQCGELQQGRLSGAVRASTTHRGPHTFHVSGANRAVVTNEGTSTRRKTTDCFSSAPMPRQGGVTISPRRVRGAGRGRHPLYPRIWHASDLVIVAAVCFFAPLSVPRSDGQPTRKPRLREEIADARERANAAADPTSRRNQGSTSGPPTDPLQSEITSREGDVNALQLAVENVAIGRYTDRAVRGLPLLTVSNRRRIR